MTTNLTPSTAAAPYHSAVARPKMATDIPASITTPDQVQSRLGTLRFFDGLPDDATVRTVYDNLDFQRAVQAFLTALPAAMLSAIRAGLRTFGPENQTVLIAESLLDSRSLVGVANPDAVYTFVWLDTKDGPLVIDLPPRVLGFINDLWGRFVVDVGNAGPDKGEGGTYLVLPPGYTGPVPDGHFVARPRTHGSFLCFRGFLVDGDARPAVANIREHLRIHPLAQATDARAMTFVNMSGQAFDTIFASDASFFGAIAQVVQEEPLEAVDPEARGLLASIGIRKDRPFAPDARMQRILGEAAAVGNATGRAIVFSTRDPDSHLYPHSAWQKAFIGGDYEFAPGGVPNLDARTLYFYPTWGVSPAMMVKMVGVGSQYAFVMRDASGAYLDGGHTYRLHLPPGIPAKDYWVLTVYDPQTRSMLQTDQRSPSLGSQKPNLAVNPDGSVDVYFGPTAPAGMESNWIQTIPRKGWFVALRLYGPLEPWFDKTWRPGEVELVE